MSFFTASVTQCIPVKHTTYQLSVSTILIKKLGLPWSTYLNYRSKRNYERQIKLSLSCICSQGVELRATGAGLNCYFIPLKSSGERNKEHTPGSVSLWSVSSFGEAGSTSMRALSFLHCHQSLPVPSGGKQPQTANTAEHLPGTKQRRGSRACAEWRRAAPVLEAATRNPVQHVRDEVIFCCSQKVIK